jgi:hypothetical protein
MVICDPMVKKAKVAEAHCKLLGLRAMNDGGGRAAPNNLETTGQVMNSNVLRHGYGKWERQGAKGK